MLARRLVEEFPSPGENTRLRSAFEADGSPSFETAFGGQARSDGGADKVLRPAAFASDSAPAAPVNNRTQALNAMRAIMKAADTCKGASLEAERRSKHASDIAKRAVEQLEINDLALATARRELAESQKQSHLAQLQAAEQLHTMTMHNQELQERVNRLETEFQSVGQLFADIKVELIDARARAAAAEARADEAQQELNYVTEFACETLKA